MKASDGPTHSDILRFYVVHKDYENLLVSDILHRLYDYTNEMMTVRNEFEGEDWGLEDFCKKASPDVVSYKNGNSSRQPQGKRPICSARAFFQPCDNILNVWLKHAENLFRSNGSRINPNLQLSYPVMYLFNRPKDIGNVGERRSSTRFKSPSFQIIYGVNVTGQKHEITGARKQLLILKYLRVVIFKFRALNMQKQRKMRG